MGARRYLPLGLVALAVIAVQAIMSLSGTAYYFTQLTMSVYYSLAIVGLCLVMGYAGQISLGHAGFFAIGGYTTAAMTTCNLLPYAESPVVRLLTECSVLVERTDLYGAQLLSFSPWVACCAAVALTTVIAYAIGIPVLRLKGHYLAMATLGFGVIVYRIVLGTVSLGEADGISEVPPFRLFGGLEVNGRPAFRVQNYYIAWACLLVAVALGVNLIQSRVGRALRSIHENEEAANALGVNTARYKLHTFVLSAVLASVAGVFLTHYNGGIGPSEASVMKSVRYVAIVAVGGMANIWGALLMGVVLNFMSLRGLFGSYDDAVFGTILIGIMLFAPHGLLNLRWWARRRGSRE